MFATRHRSRPRRSTRFVPAVDGLSARIAPAGLFVDPGDVDICDPVDTSTPEAEPTTSEPTASEPTTTQPSRQELVDAMNKYKWESTKTAVEI